jgi:hypothetical protein
LIDERDLRKWECQWFTRGEVFVANVSWSRNSSMFPVLCDHEKILYSKVNLVKVAPELSFPGVSMAGSTAAKAKQIKS